MAISSPAQRVALIVAAAGFIAQKNVMTAIGILETIGILIVSLVMLVGIFRKSVAYLGVATSAIGIISETLKPIVGLGYILYGLLLFAWLAAVG